MHVLFQHGEGYFVPTVGANALMSCRFAIYDGGATCQSIQSKPDAYFDTVV